MNEKSSGGSGLILAGGLSSRMGTDKAALLIGGKPLLLRLAEGMAREARDPIAISVADERREAAYRDLLRHSPVARQVRYVRDVYPGSGPLAGLHAGLSSLPPGYAFVMACDMPVLSAPLLRRMEAAVAGRERSGAAGPDVVFAPRQPFHALYHTRAAARIERALAAGDLRVMKLLGELDACEIDVSPEEAAVFFNLNTPEAYGAYLAQLDAEG
ncbi:molybdenum cofactor guanylyltransferase [Paenibacillus methanolicus]|uniref:Probable molybdenum cofactor guanylyltransferase n=1 Tax=Paenibacillus methanolicus TaxID=582686 RepID=A0A5S5C8A7_9BACL|nr:molybdenum cofactor guanylyltransferase [Paenibacillus methanolicus]TYP75574.1 molybdopterin-guanine dinucleotide biosynthesis protein A [Paenibacillus methanolicus]